MANSKVIPTACGMCYVGCGVLVAAQDGVEGQWFRASFAGMAGTKQLGSLCHPDSLDFAQLQLRKIERPV